MYFYNAIQKQIEMTTKNTGSAAQGVATKIESKTATTVEKSTAIVGANGKIEEKPNREKTQVLSVQDRIARNEQLNSLVSKHNAYKETQQKVESFAIGSDEHSQSLQFKDSKGNIFTTAHPAILKPVLALVREQVKLQVGVIEAEILDFII